MGTFFQDGKSSILNWILWWRVSVEEIERQVKGYDILSVTQSARGLSMLLLLSAALIISALILATVWPASDYVDVGILGIFAVLVHSGYRWAIIATMVFWTAEKAVAILSPGMALNPVIAVLWWAVYMRVFWLAFRTETVRAVTSSP